MDSSNELGLRLGRQPILDRDQRLVGYELLYRDHNGQNAATITDGSQATTTVLANALLEIGLERVVGTGRAFVNFPREFLTGDAPIPLNSDRIVIEVLEDVVVDQLLIDGLQRLSEMGYLIALDDFEYSPAWDPCLELADIVKLEVLGKNEIELFENAELLKSYGVGLLAEKVEDHETFRRCLELGCGMFQGYYFAKPDILEEKRNQASHASLLSTLGAVNDDEADAEDIADAVSKDARLTHKLLRYVNSSALGLRSKVESPNHAIAYLGRDTVRSIATLLLMSSVDDKPPVLLRTALVRGEACRNIARLQGAERPDTYFTAGLLSLLDALLGQPMGQIMEELPLTASLKEAILRHEGPIGRCLEAVVSTESVASGAAATAIGIPLCLGAYADAVAAVESGEGMAAVLPPENGSSYLDSLGRSG